MLCSSCLRQHCEALAHASPGCMVGFIRPQFLRAKAKKEGNLEHPSDQMYNSFKSTTKIIHKMKNKTDTNQVNSLAAIQWIQTWNSNTIHICN